MKKLTSCGFFVFRRNSKTSNVEFLLMVHSNRYDLCKGHYEKEKDSSFLETAYRELKEETGIKKAEIEKVGDFLYSISYEPFYKRFNAKVHKTVNFYLGMLKDPQKKLILTEHKGFEWKEFSMKKVFKIQRKSVDPLLKEVQKYVKKNGGVDVVFPNKMKEKE